MNACSSFLPLALRSAGGSGVFWYPSFPMVSCIASAGVPRSVAMKIAGHKTENVYRRYAIVSDADLQDAVRRLTGITARSDVAPAP